jgi:hypothetical protein
VNDRRRTPWTWDIFAAENDGLHWKNTGVENVLQ